jgi:hypothetical protein
VLAADPFADAGSQAEVWFAQHQFFLDGLWLADKLRRDGRPGRIGRWRRPARRYWRLDYDSPGLVQGLISILEVALPRLLEVRASRTYLPTLWFILSHHLMPFKHFRFNDFMESTRGWVANGGFGELCGAPANVVHWHGAEHTRNSELFDLRTGRTRHNIILACCHRLGFLDAPLIYEPLRGIRLGVWADTAQYGPGVARKMTRDRFSVVVRGKDSPSFKQSIKHTAELLVEARVPVLIMVDGGQPPMFYGQQVSVKPGFRLAARAAARASAGTGRRTYIVPISLNDPVGLVQGRQRQIDVRYHPPILFESVQHLRPSAGVDRCEQVNDGDPLRNHLETLFLLETAHATWGLPRPRIVTATKHRWQEGIRHERSCKRPFHASLADLARSVDIADG